MQNQPATRGEDFVHLIGLGIFLVFLGCWVASIYMTPNVVLRRDWQAFDIAASEYWSQGNPRLYQDASETDLHFLYPPFVLIWIMPLAWLPVLPSYLLCAAAAGTCLGLALWCLFRFVTGPTAKQRIVLSLTLCSAPCIALLPTAQFSALYLLVVLASFLTWQRERYCVTGLILSVLNVKPNLAIPIIIVVLATRHWRLFWGWSLGSLSLIATSLPLGPELWADYFAAVQNMTELSQRGLIPMDKQITLYSLLFYLLGDNHVWAKIVWAVLIIPLGVALLKCWWRPGCLQNLPRLLSLTVLFSVVANPYLFFYDGLLLAIPAATWYLHQSTYGSRRRHFACGVMLAASYLWLFNLFVYSSPLPLFVVSCPLFIWLMIDSCDYLLSSEDVAQNHR